MDYGVQSTLSQIGPIATKLIQAKPSKIAWFCLFLFVRIRTFQSVTAEKSKKILSPPLGRLIGAASTQRARAAYHEFGFSQRDCSDLIIPGHRRASRNSIQDRDGRKADREVRSRRRTGICLSARASTGWPASAEPSRNRAPLCVQTNKPLIGLDAQWLSASK
jgi:hypothetical protein